ncbi:MAG: CPBP family intramembrane metalloprotease [Verrucomicrobia bacterium]|nr:CPBP family intramembrane metalloprotease [Verrucomicrobiota bacterium]
MSLLLAAAAAAEKITLLEYAWLAFGAVVMAFAATRIFAPGGAQVEVERFGRAEAIAAFVVGAYYGLQGFLGFTYDGPPLKMTVQALVITVIFTGVIFLIVVGSVNGNGHGLRILFGLDRDRYLLIFALGLLFAFCSWPLVGAASLLTQKLASDPKELQPLVDFFLAANGTERLFICLSAAIVAPIAEEVFFRGIIYGVAKRYGGMAAAMVFNAALFAFVHGSVPALGGLFVLALCLTLAYEFTGSILAPIALHMAFNSASLVRMALYGAS